MDAAAAEGPDEAEDGAVDYDFAEDVEAEVAELLGETGEDEVGEDEAREDEAREDEAGDGTPAEGDAEH